MTPSSCCSRPDLPWAGRGASLDITGCRFSLYPMDSRFVPIILGALEKTDTSAVWSQSDALSTVYRGELPFVVDALRGLFVNAYDPSVHMALEGQLSKGCPGDSDGDSFLGREGTPPNADLAADFPVLCKIALYPLGIGDYIDHIARVFHRAEALGLSPKSTHYVTRLSGTAGQIFAFLQEIAHDMQRSVPHYVLHFTLSVNSPTTEEN